MAMPKRVLFVCTGNSCRSQMAEGWTRHLLHRMLDAYSAGIGAHGLNRVAVRVMLEAGVDISGYRSKRVEALRYTDFDCVITVCDNANERCPIFPGHTRMLHAGFEDPVTLAQSARNDEEALAHYRRIRDEIRAFVERLPDLLYGGLDAEEEKGQTDARDLAAIPQGADLGLSYGNPLALASLRPGEVLLDLGSGAGFDALLAGPMVGPTGRVIGVDMMPDMIMHARRNLDTYTKRTGLDNIEFRLGEIEHLPLSDATVDVVISNCAINLSLDKPQVWRDMFRVLKPGGRVAVSDLALVQTLPPAVKQEIDALAGSIAGAALVEEVFQMAFEAGFVDIRLEPKPGYIEAMSATKDTFYKTVIEALPTGARLADYVVSLDVTATKP